MVIKTENNEKNKFTEKKFYQMPSNSKEHEEIEKYQV